MNERWSLHLRKLQPRGGDGTETGMSVACSNQRNPGLCTTKKEAFRVLVENLVSSSRALRSHPSSLIPYLWDFGQVVYFPWLHFFIHQMERRIVPTSQGSL